MLPHATDGRPLPLITPVTRPYFDAAREGRLIMQHCPCDGWFFYPRERCSACLGADWEWRAVRPSGRVHSFTVDRTGLDPHQRHRVPLIIALVDLDDGPRMIGNIVDAGPDRVVVGQGVSVDFDHAGGAAMAVFRIGEG